MVDLHMHILPGLDDGSDSMEESIRMARLAAESGVNYIAASSHGNCYDYTLADYEKQFAGLQRELDRQKIPVKLYHAMEILMNRNAQQLLEEGKLLSVNHTGYLLIEFDFDENLERVYRMVAYLQRMKYNIILAHPERYSFVQEDPEIAYYLAERGCVLQVNKGSILGEMGSNCQRMAEMMLEDGIVLAALRLAKERKIPVLGIVNVVGSSIARESDYILYTYAGPEISVATTKAYSTQLIAMYLLAIQAAKVNCVIPDECYEALIEEMGTLPEKIQKTLDDKERIQWFASKYANAKDVFFIGRGIDYAISMEGSLKMKEISYIHSEAYAAGELKHGTISLIEDGILVVGVATQADLFEKTISNMVEVKSRGAYLMGLTTYGNYNIEDTADFAVYVPQTESFFATSLAIVPLQLMGYYVSVAKGLDVDKPRNLAKSVTVE